MLPPTYRLIAPTSTDLPGASGGKFFEMRGAVKENTPSGPYCVPNEYVAGEIGRLLGLPIPPGGLVEEDGSQEVMFATFEFAGPGGASLPGLTRQDVTDLCTNHSQLATGVLVFDILIANADRHRGNITVDANQNPDVHHVFDHSHALFGANPHTTGEDRLDEAEGTLAITGPGSHPPNRHCLLDELETSDHFENWFERVRAIPDFFIERLADVAEKAGCTEQESNHLAEFIRHRRDNVSTLVQGEEDEFVSVDDWGDQDD